MTRTFAEILILIPSTLTTGYLMFVATVLQRVMNELDEATFGRFVPLLLRKATRSVYAVASSSVTFVAMIPYFLFYGFQHWWFTAGLVFFVLSSVAGKLLNLPIYGRIAASGSGDVARLRKERRKLQTANWVRALLCLVSTVLMVIQFA
jgi:hypothetical protein